MPELYSEGYIVYELDERGNQRGMIAFATNLLIARAAFDEAVKQKPGTSLQLRHRARIIRTQIAPQTPQIAHGAPFASGQ